jgi:hypothetical protein
MKNILDRIAGLLDCWIDDWGIQGLLIEELRDLGI